MLKKYKPYIISLLFTFGIALLSNLLMGDSAEIYNNITKPPFAPPSVAFGIVWPILYVLMAIAAGLIYTSKCDTAQCEADKNTAIRLYIIQLIVNAIWPLLFFRFELFVFSFIWIAILWVMICKMVVQFYKINKTAAYLIIPYLLWVTFAGYLNLMIAALN